MSQLIFMNTIALQMWQGYHKCKIYNARLYISKSGVLRGHLKEGGHKEFWYTYKLLPHFCTPSFSSSCELLE